MTLEIQDIIKVLDDFDNPNRADDIIGLIGHRNPEDAVKLIWDAGLWNSTHPRKGSVNNMRILDVVFHYYTDSE